MQWQVVRLSGPVLAQGQWNCTLPLDSVQRLGDASWRAEAPGKYELRAAVRDEHGGLVSENIFAFEVVAP